MSSSWIFPSLDRDWFGISYYMCDYVTSAEFSCLTSGQDEEHIMWRSGMTFSDMGGVWDLFTMVGHLEEYYWNLESFWIIVDYCCDEIAKLWAPILIVLEAHLVGAELFHRVGQCSRIDVVGGHFADESSFFDLSWVQSIVSYLIRLVCFNSIVARNLGLYLSTWLSSVTNTKFRTYLSTLLPSGTCMIHRMWSGAQFIKVQLISWMGGSYPALSLQLWLIWFEFFFLSLCYKPILSIRGHF